MATDISILREIEEGTYNTIATLALSGAGTAGVLLLQAAGYNMLLILAICAIAFTIIKIIRWLRHGENYVKVNEKISKVARQVEELAVAVSEKGTV